MVFACFCADPCVQIRARWQVNNIVIEHKLGPCPVSHTSVAIIISSPHRKEGLEALPFAIDELKAIVPIWKKVSPRMYAD